ncbi:MAG: histidine phosphatase family protein [Planktomarina sp.]
MTEIVLIRHGQANTGATDEESYDRLSDLGHQQSAWLGEYLTQLGGDFDAIHSGTLRRHVETVASMGLGDSNQDARLNEMRYFDLAEGLKAINGMEIPATAEAFINHVPHAFQAWADGHLDHVHAPYEDFATGIEAAIGGIAQSGGRHLVVTSGGVIGMKIARILGLCPQGYAKMMLPIKNTSVHTFYVSEGRLALTSFNATPHLDHTDRVHARTTI